MNSRGVVKVMEQIPATAPHKNNVILDLDYPL